MKPTPSIHRALADVVGREEAVDVVGAQVGDHFRRRHRAQLHVACRDRGRARRDNSAADNCASNSRTEWRTSCPSSSSDRACPCASWQGRCACPLMFSIAGTVNGIAVEPSPSEIAIGIGASMWAASYSLLMVLSRIDRPAGGLHHFDVEAVFGIEAERCGHDDRRRAGDRDEADLEVLLLRRAGLREDLGRGLDREESARSRRARSTRRPISGRRGARRPSETSRASRRRRRRPRSAAPRSAPARSAAPASRVRARPRSGAGRRRSPIATVCDRHRMDRRRWTCCAPL